jgi:death-on-curing protein
LKEPIFLGLDEVNEIHRDQIERYGGHPGIRDIELAMPYAGVGADYLHADIYEMAAAYLFHITRNHPFVDGNKRTGAVAAMVFLLLNGKEVQADEDRFEAMVLSVADGEADKTVVAEFFREHAKET